LSASTVLRNVQGISNTTQGLSDVLGRLAGGSFWSQLRPASYRGVRFGVLGGSAQFGRRNAVHEYPFRDKPWVEDLGKAANRFQVSGFLVGDDVIAQRDRMVAACTKPGDGELVHPTFGRLQVALLGFSVTEHWEHGRVFELTFSFIEQGQRQYPESSTAAADAVDAEADAADVASASTFGARAIAALKNGIAVADEGAKTAAAWAANALQVGNDATSLLKLAVSLPGEFGRLIGAASGVGVGQVVAAVVGLTVQDLVGKSAAARQAVASSAAAMTAAGQNLSSATTAAYADAGQALVDKVAASAPTPGDALRALVPLAAFAPVSQAVGQPLAMRQAAADLFRRAAVAAAARAGSQYQPESSDDAAAVRSQILGLIDDEITVAGDQRDDDVYTALRRLRATVVADLNAKGASLPTLMRVETKRPQPSLALAQRLYRDPTRADELVARAGVVHPAFMPTAFQALNE